MELGCSTILYGGHSLRRAFEGISAAGYRATELCGIPGMAEHIGPDATAEGCAEIRSLSEGHGLVIESIGASGNLLDDDARRRFIRLMEAGSRLGAPAITTGSGGVSDDADSWQRVIATVRELIPVAQANNIRLSIKPHVRSAVYNTPTSLRFIEELQSDWVGLNFDASHVYRANEEPEQSIRALAAHTLTARIRDTHSRELAIGTVEQQVPGQGEMNLPAIAEGLRAVPGLQFVTLEIVGAKTLGAEEVDDVIRRCHQRLRPLFS